MNEMAMFAEMGTVYALLVICIDLTIAVANSSLIVSPEGGKTITLGPSHPSCTAVFLVGTNAWLQI